MPYSMYYSVSYILSYFLVMFVSGNMWDIVGICFCCFGGIFWAISL